MKRRIWVGMTEADDQCIESIAVMSGPCSSRSVYLLSVKTIIRAQIMETRSVVSLQTGSLVLLVLC